MHRVRISCGLKSVRLLAADAATSLPHRLNPLSDVCVGSVIVVAFLFSWRGCAHGPLVGCDGAGLAPSCCAACRRDAQVKTQCPARLTPRTRRHASARRLDDHAPLDRPLPLLCARAHRAGSCAPVAAWRFRACIRTVECSPVRRAIPPRQHARGQLHRHTAPRAACNRRSKPCPRRCWRCAPYGRP